MKAYRNVETALTITVTYDFATYKYEKIAVTVIAAYALIATTVLALI